MESRSGIHRSRRMLLVAAIFATAMATPLVPALADTVTPPPVTVPPTETDFVAPLSFEPFDPALGTLQSLTITLSAAVIGSMGIENTSTLSGSSGELELSAQVSVTPPGDPDTVLAVVSPAAVEVFDLPVFDGVLDFGGTSGLTFAGIDAEQTVTVTLTDPALLAAASGAGSFDLELTAMGTSVANATGGNISTFFLSQAGAVITVIYDYEPVPVGIAVQKQTNGADAEDPFGDDVPRVAPGGDVTWTYTVTNTGGLAVQDVVVVDDQVGAVAGPASGDTDGDGLLGIDEVWVYETSGSAGDLSDTSATTVPGCPDPDGAPRLVYRNVVTVSGTAGGEAVSAEDVSHYCNPFVPPPPGTGMIEVLLTDDVGRDILANGREFDYAVVVANVGDGPMQPDPMVLGWKASDGRYVALAADGDSRVGDCAVEGASLTIDRTLEAGEVVTCLIDVRVVDVSTRTVVAQVSANGVVLDEEPVVVETLLSAISGPPVIVPDVALPVDVLAVSLAASIDSPPAVSPGVLAATGATNNTSGVVLLSFSGVVLGLALLWVGRRLRMRAGP